MVRSTCRRAPSIRLCTASSGRACSRARGRRSAARGRDGQDGDEREAPGVERLRAAGATSGGSAPVAGDDLIGAYLRELRASVGHLRDADDMVAEAEDHLRETAERLRDGRTEAEAAAEAIARVGSATYVARVCTTEAKRGAAVPTRRTCFAGLALFLAPVLLVGGTIGNYSTGKT